MAADTAENHVLTWSGTGHAAAGTLAYLTVLVDAAHLTAMAVWLGGLALLASCTLAKRRQDDDAEEAVTRFSRTAFTDRAQVTNASVHRATAISLGLRLFTGTRDS